MQDSRLLCVYIIEVVTNKPLSKNETFFKNIYSGSRFLRTADKLHY